MYEFPNLPDVYRVRHQSQNRQYGKNAREATNDIAGFIKQISSKNQQRNPLRMSATEIKMFETEQERRRRLLEVIGKIAIKTQS